MDTDELLKQIRATVKVIKELNARPDWENTREILPGHAVELAELVGMLDTYQSVDEALNAVDGPVRHAEGGAVVMDADELLKQIRALTKRLNDARIEPDYLEVARLANLVIELDKQMSNGCVVPVDWDSAHRAPQPGGKGTLSPCLVCRHGWALHVDTATGPGCSGECSCNGFVPSVI